MRFASLLVMSILAVLTVGCESGLDRSVDSASLAASVTIVRDDYGVPHIYAPTDAGVLFGAAWAQAEDNWWQVEDNFLRSIGRASERHGEETFLDDYLVRALEIRRRSIEEYERSTPTMKALYDAYAAGFNTYLEKHAEIATPLFDRVEPWFTLALIRFKYHHNEYIGYAGLRRRGTELLLERADFGPTGEAPTGSNQMALAGSRTASGRPMLLINPHVGFFGLSQYWEVHLHSDEGLVFSGLSRFGFMLPYMGNSDRLGWAYTDNYSDIGDLYIEQFPDPDNPLRYLYGDGTREAVEWTETIRVETEAGIEAREVILRKTHHGPMLGVVEDGSGRTVPVSVRLARLDEGGWFEQWYEMMRANDLAQWKTAVSRLNVAYMNTLYADVDGNIYYIYNAAVPRRDESFDWRAPVDGSDPRTEWQGYHTLEELPQVLNPESGFLQNCNSAPLQATPGLNVKREDFPSYMVGAERHNPRARSATRILSQLRQVSLDDFARAVLDTRLEAADDFLPGLFEAFADLEHRDPGHAGRLAEAVTLLRDWDRVADVDSTATTLFVLWSERLPESRVDASAEDAIASLESTLADLTEDWQDWRVPWGELNRAQRPDASGHLPFDDALPSVAIPGAPGWLGSVFTYTSRRTSETRRRYGIHGNSFVKVIEFSSGVPARSILTFGQSGAPESPHYLDQVGFYAEKSFKPAYFGRHEVESHASRTYRPE